MTNFYFKKFQYGPADSMSSFLNKVKGHRYLFLWPTLLGCLLLSPVFSHAQINYNEIDGRENVINTAVPFLRIAPDARSAALGNAGLAIAPVNANAVNGNLSSLPFQKTDLGIAASYTPWLREMANDVFLAYLSAYKKVDELQSVGMSLRYFDMGDVQLFNLMGEEQGKTHPREFSIDVGYSRKLSGNWSVGAAMRYIHSNLVSGAKPDGETYQAGNAVAGDLSVYYQSAVNGDTTSAGVWRFGAAITNLGSKISYSKGGDSKYFIPTNLGIGGSYTYSLDEQNQLMFTMDINKLLVPTPDTIDTDKDGTLDFRQKSVVSSIFNSFGDAPGGLKEEFHELMYTVGMEYTYDNLLSLRAGYYNEYKTKGNRKYLTVGFGLNYKMAGLDFSYIIPSGGEMKRNPLSNTLRISISYNR